MSIYIPRNCWRFRWAYSYSVQELAVERYLFFRSYIIIIIGQISTNKEELLSRKREVEKYPDLLDPDELSELKNPACQNGMAIAAGP